MNASVKFSHTVFNVPLLGLNNCSDLLQCRDLWPRTSYLNSACCKNKILLASVHDEQIRTTKSRNDFNYSSSEFFDVTNAFRLMNFLLRMLLREFSGERCKKAYVMADDEPGTWLCKLHANCISTSQTTIEVRPMKKYNFCWGDEMRALLYFLLSDLQCYHPIRFRMI